MTHPHFSNKKRSDGPSQVNCSTSQRFLIFICLVACLSLLTYRFQGIHMEHGWSRHDSGDPGRSTVIHAQNDDVGRTSIEAGGLIKRGPESPWERKPQESISMQARKPELSETVFTSTISGHGLEAAVSGAGALDTHSLPSDIPRLPDMGFKQANSGSSSSGTALLKHVAPDNTLPSIAAAHAPAQRTIGLRPGFPELNVEDFGAHAGMADSTRAFRKAIGQIRSAGGGALHVPAGVFRSGPLELASQMTLFLHRGAVLKAIDDFNFWKIVDPLESYGFGREGAKRGRRVAFLSGERLHDVVITGDGGIIDGSGQKWWEAKRSSHFDGVTLPHLIETMRVSDLEISNLKLINSPLWTVHPFACSRVVVRNIEIVNPVSAHNTDGINPDSSVDVLIENVVYTGGDDGIAIKSGWDCFGDARGFNRPTRNVVIRNFTVRATRAAAIAIGSEMSGGVADVLVEGLHVERAGAGGVVCIKTTAARGGFVRNITVRGVNVGNIDGPREQVAGFTITGRVGNWVPEKNPACHSRPKALPNIEDITFEDVHQMPGTKIQGPAVRFHGLQEGQVLHRMVLRNVHLECREPEGHCSNADLAVSQVSFGSRRGPIKWIGDGVGSRCAIKER